MWLNSYTWWTLHRRILVVSGNFRLSSSLKLRMYRLAVCTTRLTGQVRIMETLRTIADEDYNSFNSRCLHVITGRSHRETALWPNLQLVYWHSTQATLLPQASSQNGFELIGQAHSSILYLFWQTNSRRLTSPGMIAATPGITCWTDYGHTKLISLANKLY